MMAFVYDRRYYWSCLVVCIALIIPNISSSLPSITSMRFLVAINVTEENNRSVHSFKGVGRNRDQYPCVATVRTPPLIPGKKYTRNESIHVGDCDYGPLEFNVRPSTDKHSKFIVDLVYHSTVIEDAMPPVCNISWNGTYLVPRIPYVANQSLLPGCFTQDSREGWHLTYYWFYILDWSFG